ncbi:MAG: exo-beta-N-acetylmuramidase NamZ family protein [Leadbetterella sp.]
MKKDTFIVGIIILLLVFGNSFTTYAQIVVGAEQLDSYLPYIKNKRVGLIVNQTSNIGKTHLVDVLISKKINVKRIFAPEHGFRGEESAGSKISNSVDKKTGIQIVSIYGKTKKPSPEVLKDLDVLIFDIQDVGVRFYTYISTLYYVMQACAENNKKLIVLDRPNPNGHYTAGPVLDMKYSSFVGVNPIPIVHGMTVAELAQMNNGEGWLKTKSKCDLVIIKCKNYSHNMPYSLPVKPSPNLPNEAAIGLYPSLCLFEPTKISVGRGTDSQFQIIGGPQKNLGEFSFTPTDKPGAHDPVNENILCHGLDLRYENARSHRFTLKWLQDFYGKYDKKDSFFTSKSFFNQLIGNEWVIKDIENQVPLQEIENKWNSGLEEFRKKRKKYLLYE